MKCRNEGTVSKNVEFLFDFLYVLGLLDILNTAPKSVSPTCCSDHLPPAHRTVFITP